MFSEVIRIREGLAIYPPPSLEYVPNIYTPIYFYVSALMTYVTGVDLVSGRLVSFIATILTCLILYISLRKEDTSRILAFLAIGFYLSTYDISARWFSVGRPDSLLGFLLVLGVFLLIQCKNIATAAIAGVVLSLAVFTKQNSIAATGLILFGSYFISPKRSLIASVYLLFSLIFGITYFQLTSGGMFYFYTIEMPLYHNISLFGVISYIEHNIKWLLPAWLLCLVALYSKNKKNRREAMAWLCICLAFIFTSFSAMLHSGGWANDYLPTHIILAILSVKGASSLLQLPPVKYKKQLINLTYTLVIIQLAILHYNPANTIPSDGESSTFKKYVEIVSKINGEVLIVDWSYIQTLAGKKPYGWGTAGWDILRMNTDHAIKKYFIDQINTSLKEKKFAAILIDTHKNNDIPAKVVREILNNYKCSNQQFNWDFTITSESFPKLNIICTPK